MARTAKEIAEQAMPGWKAVDVLPRDAADAPAEADQVGKDLQALKRTYGGADTARRAEGARPATTSDRPAAHTKMVVMEPSRTADRPAPRKVVLVNEEDDEVTGFQG